MQESAHNIIMVIIIYAFMADILKFGILNYVLFHSFIYFICLNHINLDDILL